MTSYRQMELFPSISSEQITADWARLCRDPYLSRTERSYCAEFYTDRLHSLMNHYPHQPEY